MYYGTKDSRFGYSNRSVAGGFVLNWDELLLMGWQGAKEFENLSHY